ncbi:MAG: hypothetical protein ACRD0J_03020 [Acidimicrobiales bacterium]
MESVCESCAGEDDDLVAVRRLYVTPEAWDRPGATARSDQVELWCFSCRSLYPHEAEAEDG